ncbi:MAG: BPL-N domain-containing protein [Pirellulales bacterium]
MSIPLFLTLASCSPGTSDGVYPILLFNGAGTSPNDVEAIEAILEHNQICYSTVDSQQLNDMTEAQLLDRQLLIVPGGNYLAIGNGLSEGTFSTVRGAVGRGLNYLGICAGAILAGHRDHLSFNLTSDVEFDFYGDVNRNVHKSVVSIESASGETLDQYWEDGPQLDGWGEVVSKYPDGTAATVQGAVGNGWVVLSGFHPEAPNNWRAGMEFTTPVSASHAYALTIIKAARDRRQLPHY